ncbi:MAG: aminoglycoside phosphotransferase family protein, partial [Clostridia bacterium]|nr:aminoglycoside phosphotransferase family protein [Clostridia bacterium]
VYRLILRRLRAGAFFRLFLADLAGGCAYLGVCQLLPKFYQLPFKYSVALIVIVMITSQLFRLLYCIFYRIAQSDSGIGRFAGTMVRIFAMVDPHEEQEEKVLSFDEWIGQAAGTGTAPINEVQRVARQFQITGDVTDIIPINTGYINRTYHICTLSVHNHVHHYNLQRINTNVFPNVDELMANYELVTNHLHEKMLLPGHTERGSVQMLRPTKDGKPYYRDDSGCWRMMTFFTEVYGMDIPDSPKTFYHAGQSFGSFLKCMADVPLDQIHVVIPNFHNTYSRYLALEEAIEKDPVHRLEDVWEEVRFIRQRKDRFRIISDALESGKIPTRICHNDCNLNNILFSEKTHLPVAIIDLDTVMPSTPLYDYGDSMRIGTNTAKDDETDLSKVSCDLNLYEQYARGYLEACGDMLTREELELLPFASMIITSEDGIRFLTDYLNGDTYYNVFYPNQNLDRSRTQLKLLEDMEKKETRIREILKSIYKELHLEADPFRIQW